MNLHNIVGPCVAAVNPWVIGSYLASTGSTTGNDGTRTATFATPVAIAIQKQALQYRDLVQLEGLNLNGEKCAMYVSGNWEGVARPEGKGGDMINLPDGSIWLVVLLLENWFSTDGWAKVACTRQVS